MTQFCHRCGAGLREKAHFCENCGADVSTQPVDLPEMQPHGAPSGRMQSTLGVPEGHARSRTINFSGGLAIALGIGLFVLLMAGLLLWRPWDMLLESQVRYVVVTSVPRTSTAGASAAAPLDSTRVSLAATLSPSSNDAISLPTVATTAVLPTLIPPTATPLVPPTSTPAPTVGPGYDLYVKRIDYQPTGANLIAGKPVKFNILIATDIYPANGPLFPTARLRWRAGANLDWTEGLCPADTHYAKCDSSFELTFSQPGTYEVIVEVDHRGEVAETNELNNTNRVTLEVRAAVPTAQPTSLPRAGPSYSTVTFSSAFDESKQLPVNPGKTFPYGVTIIYAYWTYNGVVPNTPFDFDWYRNGVRVDGSGERFGGASGKAFQWHNYGYYPKDPLEPGNYQFVVRMNGQVILTDTFVIHAAAMGGPIPGAISVFFTIQNGNPTGWVYDKQGIKHAPQYGTISDFRVSPGDRIVLQTDQARFSLLFDCSTTPGTFSPCDFSADSSANLPKEIRAVKSGMSGYLNISRADNWAGFRSGWEPQRYPADPVLRIMFKW